MKNFTLLFALLVAASALASGGNPPKNKRAILDCEPATVPFLENFESASGNLPECTTAIYPDNGNAWETINNPGNGFDNNTLVGTGSVTDASDKWFFTKGIQLEAGVTYKLSYRYGNKSEDTTEKLAIAYGASATVGAMTVLHQHTAISGGNVQTQQAVLFTPSADGVYYLGFRMFSDANQWSLLVDDIALDVLSCGTPEDLNITGQTSGNVSFSWTASEMSQDIMFYQYSIGISEEPSAGPTSGTTSAQASTTALLPNTTYNVFVRAFCFGHWTEWSTPVTFTTPALGLGDVEISQLKASPNPAREKVTVSDDKIIERVEVRNMLGQIILSHNNSSLTADVDISTLASGSYILTVYSDRKSEAVRLLKE